MTIKEIKMVCDAFIEDRELEQKQLKYRLYNQAYLNALMIGSVIGGKTIPSVEEVFPDDTRMTQDEDKRKADIQMSLIKDKLRDFAREANKRRKQ